MTIIRPAMTDLEHVASELEALCADLDRIADSEGLPVEVTDRAWEAAYDVKRAVEKLRA